MEDQSFWHSLFSVYQSLSSGVKISLIVVPTASILSLIALMISHRSTERDAKNSSFAERLHAVSHNDLIRPTIYREETAKDGEPVENPADDRDQTPNQRDGEQQ